MCVLPYKYPYAQGGGLSWTCSNDRPHRCRFMIVNITVSSRYVTALGVWENVGNVAQIDDVMRRNNNWNGSGNNNNNGNNNIIIITVIIIITTVIIIIITVIIINNHGAQDGYVYVVFTATPLYKHTSNEANAITNAPKETTPAPAAYYAQPFVGSTGTLFFGIEEHLEYGAFVSHQYAQYAQACGLSWTYSNVVFHVPTPGRPNYCRFRIGHCLGRIVISYLLTKFSFVWSSFAYMCVLPYKYPFAQDCGLSCTYSNGRPHYCKFMIGHCLGRMVK